MKKEHESNESFFIEDRFYHDLLHLGEEMDEEIEDLPDDWTVDAVMCESQPIQVFSADWIAQRIDEERFSEDNSEYEYEKIIKALTECIDFEKLNNLVPTLNYSTERKYTICKQDLIDAIS